MTTGYYDFKKWLASPNGNHVVSYYVTEQSLVESLCNYIRAGEEHGDMCIVIARSTVINKLYRDYLAKTGSSLSDSGQMVFRAEVILDEIMHDGVVDRKKFFNVLGGLIDQADTSGQPVRIHSEIVTLLWEQGHHEAAIAIEKLWNELADRHTFSLYCSYPHGLFIDHDEHNDISQTHNLTTHALVAPA